MKSGKELESKNIIAWFYPVKMKPFKDKATVLDFNKNRKTHKYRVRLSNGTKHKINHNQIVKVLPQREEPVEG